MTMTKADAAEVNKLVGLVAPAFAGRQPAAVGAALADLLAIWLASHIDGDNGKIDPNATDRLRAKLLKVHVNSVKALIPINHDIIHGREKTREGSADA